MLQILASCHNISVQKIFCREITIFFIQDVILTTTSDGVPDISFNTLADTSVSSGGPEGVGPTGPLDTGVATGVVGQLAVLDVDALVVKAALQVGLTDSVCAEDHAGGTDTLVALG